MLRESSSLTKNTPPLTQIHLKANNQLIVVQKRNVPETIAMFRTLTLSKCFHKIIELKSHVLNIF